jgi:DNA-binding CsgD family transcriptional regulator
MATILQPHLNEILRLYQEERLTLSQIGDRLGASRGTVAKTLQLNNIRLLDVPNRYQINKDTVYIYLYGKHGGVAIVDASELDHVKQYRWRSRKNKNYLYAETGANGIPLHHIIAGKPSRGMVIDHVNRNGLDNRRCNLKHVSIADNIRNGRKRNNTTSRYKNVDFYCGRWRVRIQVNKKLHFIGNFKTEVEAHHAAINWRRKNNLYGT